MKNSRRVLVSLLAFVLLCGTAVADTRMESSSGPQESAVTSVAVEGENNYVMNGPNGATLMVKSVGRKDYADLMTQLYPNGVIDEQGQELSPAEDRSALRESFISQHMKAYAVGGGECTEIPITPFTVTISDRSNGAYEALFYKARIDADVFVFPSEWGSQPFGFSCLSEKEIYLAYTDLGIWRLDPENMSAQKITSDFFRNSSIPDVEAKLSAHFPGSYLVWTADVKISPGGDYAIYRTNRDISALDETSIWRVNLNSAGEEQIVCPAENNDIVGFIENDTVVVGAIADTRAVNITTKAVLNLRLPVMPNFCIKSVKEGKLIFSSYVSGTSDNTVYIDRVNMQTGAVTEITHVSGYLDGEPLFSPSGNKVAVGYGIDAEMGIQDVLIIDTIKRDQFFLWGGLWRETATEGSENARSGKSIEEFLWISDEAVLFNAQDNCASFGGDIPVSPMKTEPYDIVFGNTPPSIVNFDSPLSGFASVNSKWNQPRSTGTNPHNGVDLQAALNTNVYAPYAGWTTGIAVAGSYDVEMLVDANNNRVKDDGDYRIRFYHLNSREPNGYKTQGALIGKSGNQSFSGQVPAHLHFGICSTEGGLKWLRNEVNYRHLATTNWGSGRDLDIYAQVRWNNNAPSIIAYVMDDGSKVPLKSVEMYYRTTPTGRWTEGGTMTKSGDTYSYDFGSRFPSGTTVYWMVRLTRTNVAQRAFCPAKYYQPIADPNNSAEPYGYWVNTVN